jgi:hypothetical protein
VLLSAFFLISSKLYDGVPPILSSAADFFAALLFANCSFSDATSAGVKILFFFQLFKIVST